MNYKDLTAAIEAMEVPETTVKEVMENLPQALHAYKNARVELEGMLPYNIMQHLTRTDMNSGLCHFMTERLDCSGTYCVLIAYMSINNYQEAWITDPPKFVAHSKARILESFRVRIEFMEQMIREYGDKVGC